MKYFLNTEIYTLWATPDYSVTDPNPRFGFTSTPQLGNIREKINPSSYICLEISAIV